MLIFIYLFWLFVCLYSVVRLIHYLPDGWELGSWWLRLIIDVTVTLVLPWLVLIGVGTATEELGRWLLVGFASITCLWVIYRPRPQLPFLEAILQLLLAIGLLLIVGYVIEDAWMWIGVVPIISLYILAMEKAHRAVTGQIPEILNDKRNLNVLDNFERTSSGEATVCYPYVGILVDFLAARRVVTYSGLLSMAAASLLVLFHLGLYDLDVF